MAECEQSEVVQQRIGGRTTPLVSVIIPTYNREKWLRRSIGSVQRQLVADWELLVIDDGSTDRSWELLEEMALADQRIRLLKNQRTKGVSGARNTGIDAARGEYIAFLDSDDEWLPHHLLRSLDALQQVSGQADAVSSLAERRYEGTGEVYGSSSVAEREQSGACEGHAESLSSRVIVDSYILGNGIIQIQTLVIRKSQVGATRFPEDLRVGEDGFFYVKLAEQGLQFLKLHQPHVVMWAHDSNTTAAGSRKMTSAERIRLYEDLECLGRKKIEAFPLTRRQRRQITRSMASQRFWQIGYRGHLLEKRYAEARRHFWIAMKWHPGNVAFVRTFVMSFVRQAFGK